MKRTDYNRSHEAKRAAMRAANKALRGQWRRWLNCGWWADMYGMWA